MSPVRNHSMGEITDEMSTMSWNSSDSANQSSDLNKLLAQLKCKRTLQDEAASNGQAATALYSTGAVSTFMSRLCGPEKQDLKPDIRETLKEFEAFFKEFIKDTKVSTGDPKTEAFGEVLHTPEHLIFQNVLTSEPAEWAKLVLPMLANMQAKQGMKEQLQLEIRDIHKKRKELSKDTTKLKKKVAALKKERKEKTEKIRPDNIRRLQIGLENDKMETEKIKASIKSGDGGAVITNAAVKEITERLKEAKLKHEEVKEQLAEISGDGALPVNVEECKEIVEGRRNYLDSLLWQQQHGVYKNESDF